MAEASANPFWKNSYSSQASKKKKKFPLSEFSSNSKPQSMKYKEGNAGNKNKKKQGKKKKQYS